MSILTPTERAYVGFLSDYLAWLDAGAPVSEFQTFQSGFVRWGGLCANTQAFATFTGCGDTRKEELYDFLQHRLRVKNAGDNIAPFADYARYSDEHKSYTAHLNPLRRAFVESELAEFESL